MFKGTNFIFIFLSSSFLYHELCSLLILSRDLVEIVYCVGSLPVVSGLGQGVGSDSVQIGARGKATCFRYFT